LSNLSGVTNLGVGRLVCEPVEVGSLPHKLTRVFVHVQLVIAGFLNEKKYLSIFVDEFFEVQRNLRQNTDF